MSSTSTASGRLLASIGIGAGVTVLTGITYWLYKCWKKDVMPEKWRRIGKLEELYLFPLKSCAPLKLPTDIEVACEILGLRYDGIRDRVLMLINQNDKMVTARIYPKMVLISIKKLSDTKLLISAPSMENLELDFATLASEAPSEDIHTAVWDTKLDAMLCGVKYDKWFSKFILGEENGLRLVYYPYPTPVRKVRGRLTTEPYITTKDTGTLGDATSYMLMNLASVDDLNARLQQPVVPLQFRGNFYLKMDNAEPYAEDNWGWIKIGNDAVFQVVAPCTRCIFPNINPTTGERDPDFEPLNTLKRYRLQKDLTSPVLGIHLGLRQQGTIKMGDIIYVEDK